MSKKLPFVALAAAIAGCNQLPSVGPDYSEPEFNDVAAELPDAGKPPEMAEDERIVISSDSMQQWWTQFDDRVLETLLESAVKNNLDYRTAQKRLEEANWVLLGTYSEFLPHIGANGDWSHTINRQRNAALSGSGIDKRHSKVADLGLGLDWEIDIFGGSRRATEAALASAESAGWNLASAWLALTTQIGRQYVALRTCQERIAVAEANLKLQTETYDILKSRLDSGIGDELAVNQCAYVVEQTRARIPQLMAQEEKLKNALEILAGEMPGVLHEDLKPLETSRDWLLAPQKLESLPLDMIRARPDVKSAERKLAAQCARIGVAKANWYPKLFITGSIGYQSTTPSRLISHGALMSSFGPSASWAIFSAGAIYATVKAEEVRTEQAALAYELAIAQAYEEVRNAYSAYSQEYHRYRALADAVKAAQDAVTISQDLYKNGLRDFNNVIDAQRSALSLEEELVVSRGEITLELIELYKSLGGGLASESEK
jgi:NodT family efflux transporter outer membrane factor (OMF) lipoprotein